MIFIVKLKLKKFDNKSNIVFKKNILMKSIFDDLLQKDKNLTEMRTQDKLI